MTDATIDFTPATSALTTLLRATGDDRLGDPTPCPDWTVGDLCDHIGGLTMAFTAAATKTPIGDGNPSGDASRLEDGWRERIATDLAGLAAAWAEPSAYVGLTMAGPVELPAEVAALVALNEITVHGWDLAVATGQDFDPDPTVVELCAGFVSSFDVPAGEGPFGSPVRTAADATAIQRLAGLAGRDPAAF